MKGQNRSIHVQSREYDAKLSSVAETLKIENDVLLNYLINNGSCTDYNIDSYLTMEEIHLAIDRFEKIKSKQKYLKTVEWTGAKNPIIVKNNLFLRRDIFTKVISVISHAKFGSFRSHFTDSQAQEICAKMSSSFARSTANKWQATKDKNEKEELRYQLHYMADEALKVFGGKILTLIFELPKLKFKQKTAIEVKTYQNVRPDFPLINFIDNQSKFNVAFFTKQDRKKSNTISSDVRIYNKSYEPIGSMTKEGYIQWKLSKFRPQLRLFLDGLKDKQYRIYSGVETGICDICDRTLTDPESLRIGIGPVCAKNLNLS